MRGFYGLSPRIWRGDKLRRERQPEAPDLYSPGTPDFRQRGRETVTSLPGGMLRIDLGEPVSRLSCEAQPVTCHEPEEPDEDLSLTPYPIRGNQSVIPESSGGKQSSGSASSATPDWRSSYGLSKA